MYLFSAGMTFGVALTIIFQLLGVEPSKPSLGSAIAILIVSISNILMHYNNKR